MFWQLISHFATAPLSDMRIRSQNANNAEAATVASRRLLVVQMIALFWGQCPPADQASARR
jgi:hypothetical protein